MYGVVGEGGTRREVPRSDSSSGGGGAKVPVGRVQAVARALTLPLLPLGALCVRSWDFKQEEKLGHGNFSDVYCVVHRMSGKRYALKKSRRPVSSISDKNMWLAVSGVRVALWVGGTPWLPPCSGGERCRRLYPPTHSQRRRLLACCSTLGAWWRAGGAGAGGGGGAPQRGDLLRRLGGAGRPGGRRVVLHPPGAVRGQPGRRALLLVLIHRRRVGAGRAAGAGGGRGAGPGAARRQGWVAPRAA